MWRLCGGHLQILWKASISESVTLAAFRRETSVVITYSCAVRPKNQTYLPLKEPGWLS
jgi:hypothetical protein